MGELLAYLWIITYVIMSALLIAGLLVTLYHYTR